MEILYLILIGFVAGVINTLAGGGSLLTLPMLIFLGLPPNVANGTNRVAILIQNIFGVAGFKSKGVSTYPFSLYLGIAALFGSVIGAQIAVDIKGETFNKILAVVMLLVVASMVKKPKNLQNIVERLTGKYLWLGIIAFFFIGIYGGFIQAGVGLFLIGSIKLCTGFDLVKVNSVKTFIIASYTVVAILIFAYNGKIDWTVGLLVAVGQGLGGYLGSKIAVKGGEKFVRKFIIFAILLMAVKLFIK